MGYVWHPSSGHTIDYSRRRFCYEEGRCPLQMSQPLVDDAADTVFGSSFRERVFFALLFLLVDAFRNHNRAVLFVLQGGRLVDLDVDGLITVFVDFKVTLYEEVFNLL